MGVRVEPDDLPDNLLNRAMGYGSGMVSGAAQALNPIEIGKGLVRPDLAMEQQMQMGEEAFLAGKPIQGALRTAAASVPYLGPAAAGLVDTATQFATGTPRQAGEAVGGVLGSAGLGLLGARALRPRGQVKPTIQTTPVPAPLSAPVKGSYFGAERRRSALSPAEAAEEQAARRAGRFIERRKTIGEVAATGGDIADTQSMQFHGLSRGAEFLENLDRTGNLKGNFPSAITRPGERGSITLGPKKRPMLKDPGGRGFNEQAYKHEQNVVVTFEDGSIHYDTVKGLNKGHALARARENWPSVKVESLE